MSPEYREDLLALEKAGRLRQFKSLCNRHGVYVTFQEKELVNLTSNDYLGLAGDPLIQKRFYAEKNDKNRIDCYGHGSTSSRLLSGDNDISHALENKIRSAYGREAALLYNSGYHANIGILPALFGKKDLVLSDKLNHASIHDGMRLCRADHKRFRHRDYDQLEMFLETKRGEYERVVLVTESVFSMDGDEADLVRLVALKKKYNCFLYVDEAHAVGLYGDKGLGKAEEYNVVKEIDLLIGTFGKAYASVGAYVVCDKDIYMYLVNHSRSLIFTTALPPVVLSWNSYIFSSTLSMGVERSKLCELSQRLRDELRSHGLVTDGSTNIVPVMIGDNQMALDIAEKMREKGYLIFPVRPPAVPEGTARFRLSVTANMEWHHLEGLAPSIAEAKR